MQPRRQGCRLTVLQGVTGNSTKLSLETDPRGRRIAIGDALKTSPTPQDATGTFGRSRTTPEFFFPCITGPYKYSLYNSGSLRIEVHFSYLDIIPRDDWTRHVKCWPEPSDVCNSFTTAKAVDDMNVQIMTLVL